MAIGTTVTGTVYTLNDFTAPLKRGRIHRAIRAHLYGNLSLVKEAWEIQAIEAAKHRNRRRTNLHFKRSSQDRP